MSSARERMRREARMRRDADRIALVVRRRALQGMDTRPADVMAETFVMAHYGGIIHADRASAEAHAAEAEAYARSLLRRVAEENPRIAGRIRL